MIAMLSSAITGITPSRRTRASPARSSFAAGARKAAGRAVSRGDRVERSLGVVLHIGVDPQLYTAADGFANRGDAVAIRFDAAPTLIFADLSCREPLARFAAACSGESSPIPPLNGGDPGTAPPR